MRADGGTDDNLVESDDLPRTGLTLAARQAAESILPPFLFRHSLRTFLYGRAWALRKHVSFDAEGLFVASLFHDIGLCAPYRDTRRAFQINSSRALASLLGEHGVDGGRIDRLVDAVDHHFQPVPRWSFGPEAGLLHIGAYMDATGLRGWSIRSERRAIRRRYPPRASSLALFGRIACSIRGPRSCLGIVLPELFDDRSRSVDFTPGRGDD